MTGKNKKNAAATFRLRAFSQAKACGYLNSEKGMGLIEVLIAGVIFVFVLISFGYMFAVGQGLSGGGGDRRFALAYSQESMEELEALGFNAVEDDLTNDALGYGWTYDGGSLEWSGTDAGVPASHQRQITVAYVDDSDYDTIVASSNLLRITVRVFPSGTLSVGFADVILMTVVGKP